MLDLLLSLASLGARAPVPQHVAPPAELGFVENAGQWPAAARYVALGDAGNANLLPGAIELVRRDADRLCSVRLVLGTDVAPCGERPSAARVVHHGARGSVARAYERVRYAQAWPGVDLVVHLAGGVLEYDLELAPGADLAAVELRVAGARVGAADADGALTLETSCGPLVQRAPRTFVQDADGTRHPVTSRVVPRGPDAFGFEAPERDPSRALVVDPELDWASYVGGVAYDITNAVAIGPDGRVYVGGGSGSPDFPVTAGTFDDTPPTEEDACVLCFDPNASGAGQLVWATFLSGTQGEEVVALALDDGGDVVVGGVSYSTDLPATAGAFATTGGGGADGFVAVLSGDGVTLRYLTYLGGAGEEWLGTLQLDPSGRVLVGGSTDSPDFPVTAGAFDATLGGFQDAWLALLDPAGNGAADLAYSTYFGGQGDEGAWEARLDCAGRLWFVGDTSSTDLPATAGAYSGTFAGGQNDAFVAGLRPASGGAGDLVYASYLGGKGSDYAWSLAVAEDGALVVGGRTQSTDFPTTPGAFDATPGPYITGFLARFVPSGAGSADLAYSTLYHGTGWTDFYRVAALPGGLLLGGGATEGGLPVTADAHQATYGGGFDAHLALFAPDGAGAADLLYATYYGGTAAEAVFGLAATGGDVAFVGRTKSTDLPTTPGAFDGTWGGGGQDGIVARLHFSAPGPHSTCDGKPGSNGGTARLDWLGAPSVSGADDFVLVARGLPPGEYGLAFVSPNPGTGSWFGGPRCVGDPLSRGQVRAAACDGVVADRLTQAELAQLGFLAGTTVHAQVVYRDPGLSAPRVATSDDLVFVIQP